MKLSDGASSMQGVGSQGCYVTGCGGTCNPGFIRITTQPCGKAGFGFHSTEDHSTLCCPLSSAPDPKNCQWRGDPTGIACNGRCHTGEVTMQDNKWGDGNYCATGVRAYCCRASEQADTCYWSRRGDRCNGDDVAITFAGSFLQTVSDVAGLFFGLFGPVLEAAINAKHPDQISLFCCPKKDARKWTNCRWNGRPGDCSDNRCDNTRQVQLATDHYGETESCFPFDRARVFCCEPANGRPLFPPVPLNRLFPNPPSGANVDTEYELKIDNTWGDGQPDTGVADDPDQAAFQFWILTSPEEIQISLDKRDGSHWEVLGCENAKSEDENVVRIFCTNIGDDSNCSKISLGHGVPGTILQMPQRCGPSKYAVAKSMTVSKNQKLPKRLSKRDYGHVPIIYDLKFDYEWRRVPRDLGSTQMRLDFSNEVVSSEYP